MTDIAYAKIPIEALEIAELNLNRSEFRVWLYLWKVDAFGDKMRLFPTPDKISKALNLHTRTVLRACDTLESLGLFKFKIQEWQGINRYGSKSENAKAKLAQKLEAVTNTNFGCCDSAVTEMTNRSNFGQTDPNRDSAVTEMTNRSNFGQTDPNQGSKKALEGTFTPSNYSINKDINKSLINPLIKGVNNFERDEQASLENSDQENSDQDFLREEILGNSDQENSEEDFLREEFLQEAEISKIDSELENAKNQERQIEKPIKPVRKAESESETLYQTREEKTLNMGGQEDGHFSAAAAPRFFANLSEFVLHEAKQDPAIKSPATWANACLNRNPEEWQEKWDKWEKSRAVTTTYKPEVFTPPDPEVAKRAIEEAKRLLPEYMRRNCG